MSLLVEKQSTNFCLYSHKPKYQYIDDQYADHYIVSLHGGGLLFVTDDSLWKFWKWQRVKRKHPVIIDANFHLIPFNAKCVQVEEGHFATSYIPTYHTPVTRLADKFIIEFDQDNDLIKQEYEQEILRLRAELLSLQEKYIDLQKRYIWE